VGQEYGLCIVYTHLCIKFTFSLYNFNYFFIAFTSISYFSYSALTKQEAQLSQTDRATLHVIEYFAKSLKVTQGHSK